jgi:glycosyltransferase involved in cell wall biosynthesis
MAQADLTRADAHPHRGRAPAVLKVHLWAPSFTGFGGGIAAFSREMAQGLRALGHDVRLYGKSDRSGSWPEFQLSGAAPFGGSFQTASFALSSIGSVARRRPDHIVSTHVNFGPAAQLAKRFFGTRFTLVAHGIDVHQGLPARTLAALRDADRIIAVSAWTRDRVLDLGGIQPENVTLLPNTIDESRFTVGPRLESLRAKYKLKPDERVLLTVARLDHRERYKGYDRIIEALPMVQRTCGPVRFLIVGTGEDRDRVAKLAAERGMDSAVSFAGFVPAESLVDHYRLADVFAMPSTGEGFGIVFLEAMGCGTPVIAGNRDGSVDALDGGRLGVLIEPMNVDAIAGAICSLLGKHGESWWFDRNRLHEAVISRFGQAAFRERLKAALPFH